MINCESKNNDIHVIVATNSYAEREKKQFVFCDGEPKQNGNLFEAKYLRVYERFNP